MKRKIINLEINEVSPDLLDKYIEKNQNSNFAKLKKNNKLEIFKTKALDIEKEKLYPSQTWASFNTGKPYSEHNCYWYSDNLKKEDLLLVAPNARSVPQIFIDGELIGGYNELMKSGILDS